jgi:hypothetical protein
MDSMLVALILFMNMMMLLFPMVAPFFEFMNFILVALIFFKEMMEFFFPMVTLRF